MNERVGNVGGKEGSQGCLGPMGKRSVIGDFWVLSSNVIPRVFLLAFRENEKGNA